jgi:hypothetical protein
VCIIRFVSLYHFLRSVSPSVNSGVLQHCGQPLLLFQTCFSSHLHTVVSPHVNTTGYMLHANVGFPSLCCMTPADSDTCSLIRQVKLLHRIMYPVYGCAMYVGPKWLNCRDTQYLSASTCAVQTHADVLLNEQPIRRHAYKLERMCH